MLCLTKSFVQGSGTIEFPAGLAVKGSALSLLWLLGYCVAWLPSLVRELSHAVGIAKGEKNNGTGVDVS